MTDKKKVDPFSPDDDNPEWTEKDIKDARPGKEVLAEFGIEAPAPRRGRPPVAHPKNKLPCAWTRMSLPGLKRMAEMANKA